MPSERMRKVGKIVDIMQTTSEEVLAMNQRLLVLDGIQEIERDERKNIVSTLCACKDP